MSFIIKTIINVVTDPIETIDLDINYYIAYTTHRVYIHQCPIQIVKDLNFTVMIKGRAVDLSYVDRRSYIYIINMGKSIKMRHHCENFKIRV